MRAPLIAIVVTALTAGACSAEPSNERSLSTSASAPVLAPTSARPSAPPPAIFAMPDLIGMFWTDAEPMLRAAGWAGVLIKESNVADSSYATNQIAFQSPAPGQPIEPTTMITLRFAE